MARNRYPGFCYRCKKHVPVGYGHFERHENQWLIKCVACTSGRTVKDSDPEVLKAKRLAKRTEGQQK